MESPAASQTARSAGILSGMPADSRRDRVLAVIRVSARPLDDDQIAARAGVSPRQRVNQICRALEQAGMVRRRTGPDGKIVNEWLGDWEPEGSSRPVDIIPGTDALVHGVPSPAARAVPDGDSGEQRDAERVMPDLLGAQLG